MAHGYNVLSIQRTNRRSPQVYVVTRFDCNGIRCNTVGVKGVKGIQGVKLLVRKVNGPMYYKSDYNRAVHEWNKLDVKYTTIMVTQSFKALMQRYMVTSTQMTP